MEDRLLKHSDSDESLFDDLKHVVTAPTNLLSHLVGSRTKEDREELQRILTHLPAIRECRAARASGKAKEPQGDCGPQVLSLGGGGGGPQGTPRSGSAAVPPPASPGVAGTPRGTPRVGGTPSGGAAPPALAGGSIAGTPRGGASPKKAATPLGTPLGTPIGSPVKGAASRSAPNTPRLAGAAVVGTPQMVGLDATALRGMVASAIQEEGGPPGSAAERAAAATRKAMELRGESKVRKPEDEKKAQGEATQRVVEKLAELGIDPEGMSATDILRIFYARGSGSSYWLANREAEKRLNIRASTPKSFAGVLRPNAEREIRRARDLPVTNVHEYLDQWEIAFLGDVCRSLRCFDEAAEGYSSDYMRSYTHRQYGTQSGRKKYHRPPT